MGDSGQGRELKVIQDFYDFTLWLLGHIEKFPRQHRYSLGIAMENRLQRRVRGIAISGSRRYMLLGKPVRIRSPWGRHPLCIDKGERHAFYREWIRWIRNTEGK